MYLNWLILIVCVYVCVFLVILWCHQQQCRCRHRLYVSKLLWNCKSLVSMVDLNIGYYFTQAQLGCFEIYGHAVLMPRWYSLGHKPIIKFLPHTQNLCIFLSSPFSVRPSIFEELAAMVDGAPENPLKHSLIVLWRAWRVHVIFMLPTADSLCSVLFSWTHANSARSPLHRQCYISLVLP